MKDGMIDYINDDACDDDSNRLILLNQPNKYKSLNKLTKKILIVPATCLHQKKEFLVKVVFFFDSIVLKCLEKACRC